MQCIRGANSVRDKLYECTNFNPLLCGTLATFFLTAVGRIQHTKEGDIGREKTILMTSLQLEVRRREQTATSFHPPSPHI
jgi:hypothetical protein